MSKEYSNGHDLHKLMLEGVNILADNVASTYGPKGRNVILQEKDKRPVITKDGVTVARFVNLDDPFMNVAVDIVKQASEKTNSDSGDGTTTSTILAREIFSHSLDILDEGVSPVEVKRGLDKLCKAVCDEVSELSQPVGSLEEISYVAKISSNNDQVIGDLISTAVDKVGKGGSVTIEEGRSSDTTLDLVEGLRVNTGYLSNYFITDDRRASCRYENPLIFLCDAQVESVQSILPCLEIAARESKPLVLICDTIEGQALAALIMNAARGSMKVAAIKSPRYGSERVDIMSDIAVATGAKYFRTMLGDDISGVTLNDFGTCKTIEITKYRTLIVGGAGDVDTISSRMADLDTQIKEAESLEDAKFLQERRTKLSSGVAIIRVGAPTEVEMIEKKHRIEDALEAVRSAQQEGIVPGGGTTLYKLAQQIETIAAKIDLTDQQKRAVRTIKAALLAPAQCLANNAGSDFSEVEKALSEGGTSGYDFLTGRTVDMLEEGIIDPAKVVKNALRNAVSAAGTLLTTNFAIIEE